ncbi:MAG: lysine-2,3-aminomutase-like protein [Pseudolabrys sp.]
MKTLRTPEDLAAAGLIAPERAAALAEVAARYAVAIPPALAALIDRNDPDDPIARQFVPSADELDLRPEENADPIGDHAHTPVEGIVHRYPDRVLFKLTHVCAVYCRFCFRREMVGPGKPHALSGAAREAALAYIAAHPKIWEVILTGGDPLIASARRLSETLRALAAIDHVKVLRAHTRVPIAAPETVTPALVRALKVRGKPTYVAVHVNHARDLGRDQRAAIARLADAGIPLLGQSVLLKGVNDTAEALEALMRALVECRIKPYYLHHADLAPGTAHLRTDIATGQALMRALRGRVSGLCQPEYVLDIPGGHGKAPIGPNYLKSAETGIGVTDFAGATHAYPPKGETAAD